MQKLMSADIELAEQEGLAAGSSLNSSEILRTHALRKIFQSGDQEIAPVDGSGSASVALTDSGSHG